MKILVIIDSLRKGGKERRLVELLRYFENHYNMDITVILFDKIEYQEACKFLKTKLVIIQRKASNDFAIFRKIWNISKELKPDIIHCWGSMPAVFAFSISYLQKIPLCNAMITTAKCPFLSKNWIRAKITFPFSNIILANSKAGLQAFKVKKKGHYIYPGYNFDRNQNLTHVQIVRNNLAIDTDYVVGMVGRFHPRKDFETFILAAINVLKIRQDITFLCIGDGPNLKKTQLLNEKLNPFPEKVKFTGKQDNIEDLVQIFNIGVLTTNTNVHFEGISNAILEYMAQKKPVIATRGGGTNEIVLDNHTGFLIDPFDSTDLGNKILSLINKPELMHNMGSNCLRRVNEVFSVEKMAENTYKCFKGLV